MSIMHCCMNLELSNTKQVIVVNEFKFIVNIRYCKNCGSKKAVGTGVSDGYRKNIDVS